MTPFSYEVRSGTLFLSGYVDEHVNFSRLPGFDRVNLQSCVGFSSLGLRQFLQFLKGSALTTVPLEECPVSFIEIANAISGLLKNSRIVIESLFVPFRCDECLIDVEVVIKSSDVVLQGVAIKTPQPKCHKCRAGLRIHLDPLDYFLFLYN